MTLTEAGKLKDKFPTAWAVMMDRLWELDHGLLIEMLIAHMTAGDCVQLLTAIQQDVDESREEEANNGSIH